MVSRKDSNQTRLKRHKRVRAKITNHLDLKTKDILKQALQDFDGTLIWVSHDRDFLDGLVTKVYEFGHGKVREHLCGIYEFLAEKKMEELQELERK